MPRTFESPQPLPSSSSCPADSTSSASAAATTSSSSSSVKRSSDSPQVASPKAKARSSSVGKPPQSMVDDLQKQLENLRVSKAPDRHDKARVLRSQLDQILWCRLCQESTSYFLLCHRFYSTDKCHHYLHQLMPKDSW